MSSLSLRFSPAKRWRMALWANGQHNEVVLFWSKKAPFTPFQHHKDAPWPKMILNLWKNYSTVLKRHLVVAGGDTEATFYKQEKKQYCTCVVSGYPPTGKGCNIWIFMDDVVSWPHSILARDYEECYALWQWTLVGIKGTVLYVIQFSFFWG